MKKEVHGLATVTMITDRPELEAARVVKPFLNIQFPDGTTVRITTNLAEMIGGAGASLRQRHEEMIRKAHS